MRFAAQDVRNAQRRRRLARPIHLYGRCGLGDNVYWRPLVRRAVQDHNVYLQTPWPELFRDIPGLHFVLPRKTKLRTQLKNIERHRRLYTHLPSGVRSCRLKYDWTDLPKSNVLAVMEKHLGLPADPFVFDLPDFGPSPVKTDRPVAFLRPVTERAEWLNRARNPDPQYVARAAELLRQAGFFVLVVADLEPEKEWLVGPQPVADRIVLRGEWGVEKLMASIQNAAVVVGPIGFIVPTALAFRTPLIAIGGGQGAHNHPDRIIDPRMDTSRVRFILPDPMCGCGEMLHDCPKEIADFDGQFLKALEATCSPRA